MRRLVTVTTVVLLVTALAVPASAEPPFELYEEQIDDTFFIPAAAGCGFEWELRTVGTYGEKWFFDKTTGEVTKLKVWFGGTDTATGPGGTATGNFRWNLWYDPATGIETLTGNHVSLSVPGMGVVFNESGRAEFVYESGDILSVSGPHQLLFWDVDSLCEAIG